MSRQNRNKLGQQVGVALGGAMLLVANGAIATPAATSTTGAKQVNPTDADVRFTCEYVNGQYTVIYHPESQPDQTYPWATPTELGGGWTPERRCNEISRRLESYRPDGLVEMQTGVENGYNTICVTTQQVPSCRIVLTVPPGQDPVATRDRVFENLTVADSGQSTDAVNTFRGGDGDLLDQLGDALNLDLPSLSGDRRNNDAIDLRPFLDRNDGGTGARLTGGGSQPGRNLNPDRFR